MMVEFGELLKQSRKAAHLSQEQLRNKLEQHNFPIANIGTISKWEHGKNLPQTEGLIEVLEEILFIPPGMLFRAAGKPEMAEYRRQLVSDLTQDESENVVDSADIERKLQYDINVFKQSDDILNEETLVSELDGIPGVFSRNFLDKMDNYYVFFQLISHQYLDTELRAKCDTMRESICIVANWVSQHQFVLLKGSENTYVLRTDESADQDEAEVIGYWEACKHPGWKDLSRQLSDLSEKAIDAYSIYRRLIRDRLKQ